MVVEQKQNKFKNQAMNHMIDEWPIKGRKIFVSRVGRQRKKKKYQFMGDFSSEIYTDYYYSPSLLSQRANPSMYQDIINHD